MAKLECDFYPESAAAWHCGGCNTHYGEQCIPAGHSDHWGKNAPRCIRCGGDLAFLGSATAAKPFWQMLPHFFAFPLHANSLIAIGLITLLSLTFAWNLLTLFLVLFALAAVIKYSFAILEQRGSGATTPPSLMAVLAGDEHHLFLRQIALIICMGVIAGVAGYLHPLLGVAVGIFLTLAQPAIIMVLAVEKSVRQALDPGKLTGVMLAIGWPYLLLWLCTQVILAAPFFFIGLFAQAVSVSVVVPLVVALMVYFTFALYAMLGYVLFEYQSELGFESVGEQDELTTEAFEKARALGEATVLIRDGDLERARTSLRRALDLVRDDMDLHLHYHKLLMLLSDDTALANHCNYLVELLKRQKMLGRAVPVILDAQKRLPTFKLEDMDAALELGRLLQIHGHHKAMVRLFHNLHKFKPKDPLVPAAYLLVANSLFEYFGEDAKALALANFVLAKYPNSPQRAQFEKLQAVLNPSKSTLFAG